MATSNPRVELRAQINTASVVLNDYHELLRVLQPPASSLSRGGLSTSSGRSLVEDLVSGRASLTSDEVKQELKRRFAHGPHTTASSAPQQPTTRGSGGGVDIGSTYELCLDGLDLVDIGGETSPLRQYTNLRKLSLQHNNLTAQSLSPAVVRAVFKCLPELREVQLGHNSIDKEAVLAVLASTEAGAKLEALSMPSNLLRAFNPVTPMMFAKLTTLDLSHNKLVSFSTANLKVPCLTTLDLSYNELTSLAGSTFTGTITGTLEVLYVSGNKLSSLQGVDNLPVLEELHASNNHLRYLPAHAHQNPLRMCGARVKRTKINDEGDAVVTTGLCLLDVSHNDISSLSFFPPPSTKALENIWSLNLSSNKFLQTEEAAGSMEATMGQSGLSTPPPSHLAPSGGDDIGDAQYGEDDNDAPPKRPTSAAVSVKSAVVLRGPRKRSQQTTTTASSTVSSVRGVTNRDGGGVDGAAATASSFLSRLSQIFPSVELLNVSHNGRSVVTSYSELRHLHSCRSLSEICLDGTLDVGAIAEEEGAPTSYLLDGIPGIRLGMSTRDKHLTAVMAMLPGLTMLDGATVQSGSQPPSLGGSMLSSRPGSRMGTSMRPQSALGGGGSRPGTAQGTAFRPTSSKGLVVRDGASESERSTALQAARAKAEREQIIGEMQGVLERGIASRDRCQALREHMSATVEWALVNNGRGDAPDEPRSGTIPQVAHRRTDSSTSSDADEGQDDVPSTSTNRPPTPNVPQGSIAATPPRGSDKTDQSPRTKGYGAPPGSAPAVANRPLPVSSSQSTPSTRPPPREAFGTPQRAPSSSGKGGRLQPLAGGARPASSDQARSSSKVDSRLLPTGTSLAQTPNAKRSNSQSEGRGSSSVTRKPATANYVPSVLRTMKERSAGIPLLTEATTTTATASSSTHRGASRNGRGAPVDSGTSTVSPKTETAKRREQHQQRGGVLTTTTAGTAVVSTSTATSPAKQPQQQSSSTATAPVVVTRLALPSGPPLVSNDNEGEADDMGGGEGPYVGMQPGVVVSTSDPRRHPQGPRTTEGDSNPHTGFPGGRGGRLGGGSGPPVLYTTTSSSASSQQVGVVPNALALKPRTFETGNRPGSAGGVRGNGILQKASGANTPLLSRSNNGVVDPTKEGLIGAATILAESSARSALAQIGGEYYRPPEKEDAPATTSNATAHPKEPTFFTIDTKKGDPTTTHAPRKAGASLNARTRAKR